MQGGSLWGHKRCKNIFGNDAKHLTLKLRSKERGVFPYGGFKTLYFHECFFRVRVLFKNIVGPGIFFL